MCIRWISWISCVSTYKGTFNLSFTLVTVLMFPRSRDPPLPFSEVFLLDRSLLDLHHYFLLLLVILLHTFRIFKWVDHHRFQKNLGVSLNIVGRLWHYRIEAATADHLAPLIGQIFDDERQAEMQQNMWKFLQMMMTMNPTLMNSQCSCLYVYQPCRGPQTDTSGPEPCAFSAGTTFTVGHSTGPGPGQCDLGWNIVSPHGWWIQSLWGGWST